MYSIKTEISSLSYHKNCLLVELKNFRKISKRRISEGGSFQPGLLTVSSNHPYGIKLRFKYKRSGSSNLGLEDPNLLQNFNILYYLLSAFVFLSSSTMRGTTLETSPTIPRSATSKMGASGFLLIAMINSDSSIPARCWIAPEIPQAR